MNVFLLILRVIRAYRDNHEKHCSQISVSTYIHLKNKRHFNSAHTYSDTSIVHTHNICRYLRFNIYFCIQAVLAVVGTIGFAIVECRHYKVLHWRMTRRAGKKKQSSLLIASVNNIMQYDRGVKWNF